MDLRIDIARYGERFHAKEMNFQHGFVAMDLSLEGAKELWHQLGIRLAQAEDEARRAQEPQPTTGETQ